MIRLGVNIDHVATVRNARGESYPSPVQAAAIAELGGADNITCHLREDRRHIKDRDVFLLKETINIPLNFEMAATDEMMEIALKLRPHSVTLVPEKRQELTTEGGLDVKSNYKELSDKISAIAEAGILPVVFIAPDEEIISASAEAGAGAIELHTGDFCHNLEKEVRTSEQIKLLEPFKLAAFQAHDLGMQVHFGHGLHYGNAYWLQSVPFCEEANIGHSIVARAIFVGLEQAVREMKDLLNDSKFLPALKGQELKS
tara:strand:- start:584 stop:1354 length:771 start_codon:yes stop_codon:yes gene_type:complete